MTRVMDGVCKVSAGPAPVVRLTQPPRPQPQLVEGRRFVVGMDGIRRPVMASQSEAVASRPGVMDGRQAMSASRSIGAASRLAAAVPMAPAMPVLSAPAAMLMPAPAAQWRLPELHWPALRAPQLEWRRPAVAFGMVATALVSSGLAVHALATPRTTTVRADNAVQAHSSVAPLPATSKAPAAATAVPQKAGLQQILDDFVAANGNAFGIVVKDLKTGQTASIQADRQMTSASLYKLFVAQRIYQRMDIGQLDYGKAAGGGTSRNIDQCLRVMINISDNACGRALGTILGWGNQDRALRLEGYNQTTLATPQQTSASDVATLFTRLYNGTLLSPPSSERFLDLLKDQRVNNRLPVGLPKGTVIAHKTGDLNGVVHDAGIVYGPKTDYLVVMMSGPWQAPAHAPAMFADLSQKLWNYFEQ